jgi:hypothetical protein
MMMILTSCPFWLFKVSRERRLARLAGRGLCFVHRIDHCGVRVTIERQQNSLRDAVFAISRLVSSYISRFPIDTIRDLVECTRRRSTQTTHIYPRAFPLPFDEPVEFGSSL